jgi:uncharacterized protein (DUF983 family)
MVTDQDAADGARFLAAFAVCAFSLARVLWSEVMTTVVVVVRFRRHYPIQEQQ